MSHLLEVEGLSVNYTTTTAGRLNSVVNGFSFQLPAGRVVGIAGESGSGKSTAMLAVLGLTRMHGKITSGSVKLDGSELLGLPLEKWQKIRGRQIGLVTQNPRASLNPVTRVGDQISAVYRIHTRASAAAARRRALELLRLVGINDPERRYRAYPSQLSGGMAQRIVISMALACAPRVLIADEPTSGLDVTVRAQILDDLVTSVRAVGSGLVIVSQDLSIMANYCDQLYMVHAGEVVENAPVDRFFDHPHHPATLALLAAEKHQQAEQFSLRGLPVDTHRLPKGCYLVDRCPFAAASAGCQAIHPALGEVESQHAVRCHRAAFVAAAWTGMAANAS